MVRSPLWGLVGRFRAVALLLALVIGAMGPGARSAGAWEPPDTVYFSQTGHVLSGDFLTYWRDNGRLTFLGAPITEQFKDNGATIQYFEKARLELRGDTFSFGALGTEALTARGVDLNERPHRARLLRGDEFDEPSTTPYTRLAPVAFSGADADDHRYFAESGHTLNSSFKLAWEKNDGLARYGLPLSEEFAEISPIDGKIYTTQYFERARFEYHPETANNYSVVLTPLGTSIAQARKIDTAAIAQADIPTYDEALFAPPPPTAARPGGGGGKLIDVNLSKQYLTAFDGNTVAFQVYISSGRDEHETPVGTFTIFSKLVSDDMRGPDPDLPGGQ
jgi:hypothetical protein